MAATTYQILYRATNLNTGIIITNDPLVQVNHLSELYHPQHKIVIGNIQEKKDAVEKKTNDIINGNDANNVKYAQLYQYVGTKRINKRIWVPESTGYIIRDWQKIKDKITNTNYGDENGDYSGEYLLFEGDTPTNGVVVCRKNPMLTEHKKSNGVFEIKTNNLAANGKFYQSTDEIKELLINSTIAQIDWDEHPWIVTSIGILKGGSDGKSQYWTISKQTSSSGDVINYHSLGVFVGGAFSPLGIYKGSRSDNPETVYDYLPKNTVETGIGSGRFPCTNVKLTPDYIKTYTIPGHWEETTELPYTIQDMYEKVPQEPWFPYSVEHSLEIALEKSKALIEKIGLENVKLVKVVPTDQFLKLK